MIIPTKIDPALLRQFVQQVGGLPVARRILAIPGKQIEQWCESGKAPQLALKLLWTATPAGAAAQDDALHQLNVRLLDQVRCLTNELACMRADHDLRTDAANAEQKRLQSEVLRLKSLLYRPGLSTVLDRLASELSCIADATRRLEPLPATAVHVAHSTGAVPHDAGSS